MSLFKRKKKIDVVLHRPGSTVYEDGRYLVVDMRVSMRSKRGRAIVRETATAMLVALGLDPDTLEDVEVEIGDESDGIPLLSVEHPKT